MLFQAFAKEGAQVIATDINEEKLKELNGVPGTVLFIVASCCHLVDNQCNVLVRCTSSKLQQPSHKIAAALSWQLACNKSPSDDFMCNLYHLVFIKTRQIAL